MNAWTPKEIVYHLGSAVIYVATKDIKTGDAGIGTAFHIGRSYFATAKHVLDEKHVTSAGRNDITIKTHFFGEGKKVRQTVHPSFVKSDIEGIFHHPNDQVDVSIFKLKGNYAPTIGLDRHSIDLSEGELIMRDVLVLGYPPIPTSKAPHIVVFQGQISAVIENYHDGQRHYVISGMARGGFSGGVVVQIDHPHLAIGLVARSLVKNAQETELGFIGALDPKTIREVADAHQLKIN